MKYMCLIYQDEKQGASLSESELAGFMTEMLAFTEQMQRNGHYLQCGRLQFTRMATTIRNRNGEVLITDGPFAETKEQLGGYFLIEASDLDEAIGIASQIPATRWGSVELRPMWEMEPS